MRALGITSLTVCLLFGGTGASQAVVKCVGDSITEGLPQFDEENMGGYPGRLQPLLRQGGMSGVSVRNFGVSGDGTVEILARIGGIVSNGDTLVLLAGSNDVTRTARGEQTLDDLMSNLAFMLKLARDKGMRVIVGTLPPRPPSARDGTNTLNYDAIQRIRAMAFNQRYEVVDFWDAFPHRQLHTYAAYYTFTQGDPVGHPNAAGFAVMAETAAGVILDGDSQHPVDGRLLSPGPVTRVNADTDYSVELYDFDSGILLSSATLLINDIPVETTVTGNSRKAILSAEGDGRRRCKVVLSVQALDKSEPPNMSDLRLASYPTPQKLIVGDVNGDCRVDGRDVAIFGRVFGKDDLDEGFDDEMDIVRNGAVDGNDFAAMAANFGRGDLPGSGSE